jgi:hypothetical protein
VSRRHQPTRRILVLATLAVAVALTPAGAGAGAETQDRNRRLPPSSRTALVKLLGPRVEPLGLHVTRAALVDAENRRSPTGTHLAVYVEPDGPYTPTEYLAGTITVSRVFLPFVFDRWPGLRSFDVCQEPVTSVDDRSEPPPPETQVFVRRRGAGGVDWEHADLAALLAESDRAASEAGDSRPVALTLFVAEDLQRAPEYEEAVARASADAAITSTTGRYR